MDDETRSHTGEGPRPLATLSDHDLLRGLNRILAQSRRAESDLVAHIAEVDTRRLFARQAFPSMFAYCTGALHLSESEAYLRIAAARASRAHPTILTMLSDGRLHLSGIALLAPHLTRDNRETLLRRATHRSKREIDELVAELTPQGDVPARMRKLPESRAEPTPTPALTLGTASGMGRRVTPALPPPPTQPVPDARALSQRPPLPAHPVPLCPQPGQAQPASPPLLQPLAPGRYKVQFTASAELRRKLERPRALMRSQIPDGDLGAIIETAVSEKLERLEARRFGATRRARKGLSEGGTSPGSRHIPAPVRRAVRERDEGRCRFVDAEGRRCGERDRLEYHHRRPFGVGGGHRPENLSLMCHAHNALLAEHDFGRTAMARFTLQSKQAGRALAGASAPT